MFLFWQRGTPVSEASEQNNNQPHIVYFKDPDGELDQFFISIEQALLLESGSLSAAIFYCVAAHFVFNLNYHKKSGDVWVFIQEKVLGIPSKPGVRCHPSSLAHFSGISRFCDIATSS